MLQFLKKIKGVEMANILITGASRGIGKSIAKLLSYENNVFITARNEELLSSLSKEIKALSLPCDLCEDISKLKDKIYLHDIIGGIGYIVGIFGLWALIRASKMTRASQSKER